MHVLKPSHVKKVAEAMKVRVAVDPVLMNITCEVLFCGKNILNLNVLSCLLRSAITKNSTFALVFRSVTSHVLVTYHGMHI